MCLTANLVKGTSRVIGIDMTDEMLEKARKNAADNGYTNVEFRKGDIEAGITVEENSVDVVCVLRQSQLLLAIFMPGQIRLLQFLLRVSV
jgi:ubiquinone/menaquinone biosynthesis C-methylase UbiE